MKTIFVRMYSPSEIFGSLEDITTEDIKEYCFIVNKYSRFEDAIMAYANTGGTLWSTLLEETENVQEFINDALSHIMMGTEADIEWLEHNFT